MPRLFLVFLTVAISIPLAGCVSDPNFRPPDPRTYEPPVYDGSSHGGR
ncbi:hypothetical protein M8997_006100 [Phyllobacterium sp. 21LDTY02-6]|nr:hypothetical protein [Phyllobacterium sp. 21LDTY02-6]MCO4316749.1 hypothetical protein [Phyllobacterium sp. 21LDTY02-6]